MKVKLLGSSSFSHLRLTLAPGEHIVTESGAMSSMDKDIDLKSKMNGGFFKALLIKFLGKESFFINRFSNTGKTDQNIFLTRAVPGQIVQVDVNNQVLYIQAGSYIASTPDIKFRLSWAGFSSFLAGEGLFRLRISGQGTVWYGAYGAIIEKEVKGDFIVDSGHLLSYPENMQLKIKMSGGIFSSVFSGEGLVLKLTGNGKIKLQTRSINGLAGWLNARFWG